MMLPVYQSLVAAVMMVAGQPTAADELLDKLAKAPDEESGKAIESDVWEAWLHSGSPTVDILMKRGVEALEGGEADLAREMFDKVIAIKPDYAEGWNRRALMFFTAGKYDEAIADLEQTLRLQKRHFGAWVGLARIFESIGRPQAALKAYREALKIHPQLTAAKDAVKRLASQVDGRSL